MNAKSLLALGLFSLSLLTQAEEVLLKGTLGGKEIVAQVTLSTSGRIESGTYFYRQFGRQISLDYWGGKRLAECAPSDLSFDSCNQISGYWEVKHAKDGLSGVWRSADRKKSLPIALTTVEAPDIEKRYRELRLEGGKQTALGKRSENGIVWQIVKDHRSDVAMPILLSGPEANVTHRVNEALKALFDEHILGALDAADYSADYQVLFANRKYLTVGSWLDASIPGAAHPTSAFDAKTFDLTTGEQVALETLFRRSDKEFVDLRLNDRIESLIFRAMQRRAQEDKENEASCPRHALEIANCNKNRCDTPSSLALYPTPKGLAANFDFYSEAARICRGEFVILPWNSVQKALLKPGSLP